MRTKFSSTPSDLIYNCIKNLCIEKEIFHKQKIDRQIELSFS